MWKGGSVSVGKLRLIFIKEGRAVYISHLDLLRTFQRVFLRQGLVLRHSQGFHPHPILSFALPLPVGQSSACEVLDFEVVEDMDGKGLPESLNRFMPEGIRAVDRSEERRVGTATSRSGRSGIWRSSGAGWTCAMTAASPPARRRRSGPF